VKTVTGSRPVLIGAALLVLGAFVAVSSEINAQMAATTAVWALMGIGWNIVSGYCGPLTLGQGAFFGLSWFLSTILFANHGVTPYLGILVGVAASVVLALVVGLATLRLGGLYFALATLTIPLIMATLARYFEWFEILRPYVGESTEKFQFNSSVPYYFVAAALVMAGLVFTAWLQTTRTGRYFVAIRENERAAEASGIPTFRYKLYAFMIASVFAALAGGIFGQIVFVFTPDEAFSPIVSIQALLIVLIGGSGTVLGPLLGACIVIPVGQLAADNVSQLPGLNNLVYAAVLLLVAFWARRGLYPVLAEAWGRMAQRRAAPAPRAEEALR
jgi:ABC-type branched-subunit amino acid transport system permease subunit